MPPASFLRISYPCFSIMSTKLDQACSARLGTDHTVFDTLITSIFRASSTMSDDARMQQNKTAPSLLMQIDSIGLSLRTK